MAMIDRELERFGALTSAAGQGDAPPMDALKQTMWAMFQFTLQPENLKISRLLLIEAYTSSKVQSRFNDWVELADRPAVLAIEAAQRSGDIIDANPASLAEMLRDLLSNMPHWARCHGAIPPAPDDAKAFFEERWAFFIRAVSTRR